MEDKLLIEIDLAGLPVGEDGNFRDHVARLAAGKIIERGGDLYSSIAERVRGVTDEEIRAGVRPLIEEALASSVQPTGSFGEPKGEPRTLREVILETATKMLREPKYERGTKQGTAVEMIVREEVGRAVRTDLQKAMQEAQAEVREAVRQEGAQVIAETIERLARR